MNQPGYVVLEDGTRREFTARSHKTALKAVMRLLEIRTLTRQALRKVRAVAIYFGRKACQIFPFRQHRSKDFHADHMANRDRLRITRKEGLDIGRRRHYVAWQPAYCGI